MSRTVVLVHGAHHGGWCWRRVSRPLQREGWEVHAPSLTGCGDRAHLLSERVTLDDRVQDIVGLIEAEELDDVVLCAHSAGGMVATAVADRIPRRLAAVVMLDAIVPLDGQSMFDVLAAAEGVTGEARRAQSAQGWRMPVSNVSSAFFGVTATTDQDWLRRRLTDDSAAVMSQRLAVANGLAAVPRRVYVRASDFANAGLDAVMARLSADPSWATESWATGHDVMIDAAERVVDLIRRVDADGGTSSRRVNPVR